MASVRATLSRVARATAVATWATSRAWVSRVRWWSSGKTKTWVFPASRRKAVEWRIRSRSRSKQVRSGSGSSGRARFPAPAARVAPDTSRTLSAASRSARASTATDPVATPGPAWARRMSGTVAWPSIVEAHRRARSLSIIRSSS